MNDILHIERTILVMMWLLFHKYAWKGSSYIMKLEVFICNFLNKPVLVWDRFGTKLPEGVSSRKQIPAASLPASSGEKSPWRKLEKTVYLASKVLTSMKKMDHIKQLKLLLLWRGSKFRKSFCSSGSPSVGCSLACLVSLSPSGAQARHPQSSSGVPWVIVLGFWTREKLNSFRKKTQKVLENIPGFAIDNEENQQKKQRKTPLSLCKSQELGEHWTPYLSLCFEYKQWEIPPVSPQLRNHRN